MRSLLAVLVVLAAAVTTSTQTVVAQPEDRRAASTASGEYVVWVVGDMCTLKPRPIDCGDVGRLVAADSEADALLIAGDAQHPNGVVGEYRRRFDRLVPARTKALAHPAPGNHDYYHSATADGYFDYFGPRAGARPDGWYSFGLGSWRLVAVNTNCNRVGGCGPASRQGRFLATTLAGSQTCELVFGHHPALSDSGSHGGARGDTANGRAILTLASRHRAELYVSGHEHAYERFAPQGSGGGTATGVRQLVVGTGGASLSKVWTGDRSQFRQNTAKGAVRLVLGQTGYQGSFVAVGGRVLDSFTGRCR